MPLDGDSLAVLDADKQAIIRNAVKADVKKHPSPKYTLADKQEAMELFLKGFSYKNIAEKLDERYGYNIHTRTLQEWSERMGWSELRKDVEYDLVQETKDRVVASFKRQMEEIEEVRQEFLERMRRKTGGSIRGHEFAKLTEMLAKMQGVQEEKEELVTHINECIQRALADINLPRSKKHEFLRRYIALLKGEE